MYNTINDVIAYLNGVITNIYDNLEKLFYYLPLIYYHSLLLLIISHIFQEGIDVYNMAPFTGDSFIVDSIFHVSSLPKALLYLIYFSIKVFETSNMYSRFYYRT